VFLADDSTHEAQADSQPTVIEGQRFYFIPQGSDYTGEGNVHAAAPRARRGLFTRPGAVGIGAACCVLAMMGMYAVAGEYRIWRTSDGRHSHMKMTAIDRNETEVLFKREDNGQEFSFPVSRLSKEDQKYLSGYDPSVWSEPAYDNPFDPKPQTKYSKYSEPSYKKPESKYDKHDKYSAPSYKHPDVKYDKHAKPSYGTPEVKYGKHSESSYEKAKHKGHKHDSCSSPSYKHSGVKYDKYAKPSCDKSEAKYGTCGKSACDHDKHNKAEYKSYGYKLH